MTNVLTILLLSSLAWEVITCLSGRSTPPRLLRLDEECYGHHLNKKPDLEILARHAVLVHPRRPHAVLLREGVNEREARQHSRDVFLNAPLGCHDVYSWMLP